MGVLTLGFILPLLSSKMASTGWTSFMTLSLLAGAIGAVAAIIVGIGILKGWGDFASSGQTTSSASILFCAVAVV